MNPLLIDEIVDSEKPASTTEIAVEYPDGAICKEQAQQADILSSQLNNWSQQLSGNLEMMKLPTDRPRSASQAFRSASQSLVLSQSLIRKLRVLSQTVNTTLFVTLLAAFKTLLYRYTGTEDIIVGSPIIKPIPTQNKFVNLLIFHTKLSSCSTFLEILNQTIRVNREADDRQDLPFSNLGKELKRCQAPDETATQPQNARSPFQVSFVFQEAESGQMDEFSRTTEKSADTENSILTVPSSMTTLIAQQIQPELMLEVEKTDRDTIAQLHYNAELFDASSISRMLGHFQTLLEAIVANPEQRIAQLPLLTETERHQLLIEWNNTQVSYPSACIHQLFEAQVEGSPETIAVSFKGESLTYRELNEKANQLAHYLQFLGVKPETLVGIYMERSLFMAIAFLGILKAGAAYVPLDPTYPPERISYMIEDAKISVLLIEERLLEKLPQSDAKTLLIDADWSNIAQHNRENLPHQTPVENLAYIIYTSGSTGKPKGVSVTHQGVVNHGLAMAKQFDLKRGDRVLQFSSISFDIATEELFPTWFTGATLVLRTEEMLASSLDFTAAIEAEKINILDLPTAFWHEWTQGMFRAAQSLPESLRMVIVGGEKAQPNVYATWLKIPGSDRVRWLNTYGPTETTVTATVYEPPLEKNIDKVPDLPIGKPIANTQIYLLDTSGQPVPVGIPGELHIGGTGVTRGYLNRPELTAEKFIPNPYGQGRLYKTGDLARYRPDGTLEYVGRIDNQVKIRGFRIEPGEIEAAIASHPSVQETIVLAREDVPGDKRLVAYIVPNSESAFDIDELRRFLKEKLPPYMVPSAIVTLSSLPVLPNGKIDRRALKAPTTYERDKAVNFVAPRTPIEEVLSGIFCETFGLESVGIDENFFELGGHSLLAFQLISRLRRQLSVEISLRVLFEKPTVAELADTIETALRADIHSSAPPLLPIVRESSTNEPISQRLPLSFAQFRLWFLDQLEPNNPAYNLPTAVRLSGALDVAVLERSLNEIVRRHEALRTIFGSTDGEPYQVILPPSTLALPVTDLCCLPKSERESTAQRLLAEKSQRPFHLNQGPLIRHCLLRLDVEEHILWVNIHHIVSDGWSENIFFKELGLIYNAFSQARPSPLPELFIQYADFASWQRQWLDGVGLSQQLSYWKQQLGGTLPVLELPLDRPRPPIQTFTPGTQSLVLPEALSSALKALSKREGATLFMTLLAAFKTLLSRYSGQEDIIVGSPIAGRNRSETEALIGFFINTVVLRTHLDGNPSFQELLSRVRTVALDAYAHQDMPFEKLVEELHPERDLSRTPLFQVWFNMLNLNEEPIELAGLQVENFDIPSLGSKFDLSLYLEERHSEIELRLVYNAELFGESRPKEMLAQFQHLLAQIAENPHQKIAEFSLVSPESRALLPDPSAILPQPRYELITDTLTRIGIAHQNRDAICQGDSTWSYGQLLETAKTIARALRSKGSDRQDVVAIFGTSSFGAIASIIGAFFSGGVILTIDRNLPLQRQQLLLQEAKAKRLLYVGDRRAQDAWIWESLEVLCVDANTGAIDLPEEANPSVVALPELHPDDPAYIFFTSGTTGVPKGVLGCHKGLSHFLTWQRQTFAIPVGARSAQLTGLSFDVLLRDIFLPLTSGATVCLQPENDDFTPARILSWLESQNISILHTVPSLAQFWLANIPPDVSLHNLRWVFFAGEPLMDTLVRELRENVSPECAIINLYGPTETTMAKCFYRVPVEMSEGVQPVGAPLPQTQALVLKEGNQLCGIGESGQIVIRTPFRTLGYVNATLENQQRFAKNPWGEDEGDLVYYTGDRGRYRPDGLLEIKGRLDNQIKIRGVRIEPGEIEAAMTQHPAVRQSVVVAREDVPGEKRLVAYLVSDLVLERVLLQTRCRVEWSDTAEDLQALRQHAVDLTTIDISADGIGLLNVPATWETGQLVRCGLQLPAALEEKCRRANSDIQPDDDLAWFEGTVAWLQGDRAGILFQTTPAQLQLLRKIVKHIADTQGIQVSDLRRADPRVPLQSPCLVELSNGIRVKLTTENLSAGGVRLTGKAGLWKQGENVRLWLQLPGEERPIALQGSVSWHWGDSVGIQFAKGEDAQSERTLISQLLHNIRRADPRLPLRTSASVEFEDGTRLSVATENISRGGIRLIADADIWKDNQRLRLSLQLPGLKDKLGLNGTVLWHQNRRAGIQFNISSTERTLLDRSVEYIIATQELSITHLRSFLKEKLPAYAMPSTFVMLDALPLTPNGKVDRRALPAPDFDRLELDTSFAAPSDILERQLADIWEKVLGIKSIGIKDNFFDLGGHSLLAVRLFSQIEKTFGKNLPLATLFQAPTIEQLAGILRSQGWVAPWHRLVTIQASGDKSPLFFVHANGGNVLSYMPVAYYMGKDRPIYGLQSRGLDGIQPPHTRVEEMASDYIQEMRTVQPNGPYFLAGHSFGGNLAFEIAQQLTRAGQKVALLALLDTFCPNILTDETPPFRYQLSIHKMNLSRLKPKEKLVYIVDRVWWKIERLLKKITNKFFSRSGQSNTEQLPEHLERIQEANYLAARNYIPQVYPGRVTLLRAIERPTSTYYEPFMGWGEVAAGGVEIVEVPGHHKTMILEPRVRILAKKLKNCVEQAEAEK